MSASGKFLAGGGVLILIGSIADKPGISGLGVWLMIGALIYRWLAKKAAESTVSQPAVAVVHTEVQAAIVAERFILPVACAKTDRLFLTVFERTDPRRAFRITGTTIASPGVGVAIARSVPLEELNRDGLVCPFCATAGPYISCRKCETAICRGGVARDGVTFQCRESCGLRARLCLTTDPERGIDGGAAGVISVRQRGFISRGGN